MRNDTPAALPLVSLIAGLAAGPLLVHPRFAALALLVLAFRFRAPALFAATGIVLALHVQHVQTRERVAFESLDAERFVSIEAPLERDWMARDGAYVLRAPHFRANGVAFTEPIAIYTRFEPPQIANEADVRVEAFLRRSERGAYSVNVKSPALLAYGGALAWWHPKAWNRALANRIEPHAARHPQEAALAQALVLGRGELLDDALREDFRRGGTYHLLVFSGLQIACAAAILAALLRWLHKPRASDWLLLAFAVVAPLFIGPTASVSRASLCIGLYALSRIAKRPTSIENLWCVAALLRLLAEPRDLTDPSFHLTYAGAGALLFIGTRFFNRARWLAHATAAEIVMTPLTLFHFNQYALGGSFVTLAMAPLIFAMLVVSIFAFAFPCDATLAAIALLHRVCSTLNGLAFSGYSTPPPLAALLAGAALALVAIAGLREKHRAYGVALAMLIPTAFAIASFVTQRSVEHPRLTFFDVGQGDAIAIRSGARTILVDGGPERRIVRLLAKRGLVRIDEAILTHAHPDHCDGLASVVEQLRVAKIRVSPAAFKGACALRLLDAAQKTHTPIHLIRDGDRIALPEVAIDAIVADHRFRRARENNASVVLRVETQSRRFLLTGDIEREAELVLADRDLRADVLKVAHHGSRTSSAPSFLEQVRPRLAVISCGRRNLFGHPHPIVLEALEDARVGVKRTDKQGTIDVEVDGGRLYVRTRKD